MSKVIDTLENDLKTLAYEAGRSLPAVKEAAAIAITRLESMRDFYVRLASAALAGQVFTEAKLEDVFRPFLLACNDKNASSKVINVALSSIQRLLHVDVLDTEERRHVMHVLIIQSKRTKSVKEIEVKILQTMPLLLTPRLHAVAEDTLFDAVGLCCKFYADDSGLASAALTQILNSLFDKVDLDMERKEEISKDPLELKRAEQNSKSALSLLEELTIIIAATTPVATPPPANLSNQHQPQSSGRLSPFFRSSKSSSSTTSSSSGGGGGGGNNSSNGNITPRSGSTSPIPPSFFGSNSIGQGSTSQQLVRQMPKSLALELLETILSGNQELFTRPEARETYGKFVRERVCPVLIKSFGRQCDWRLVVRLMRTVVVLLCSLRSCLSSKDVKVLLNVSLNMLDDKENSAKGAVRYDTPIWHRVLTLETLNILCSHQDLLGEFQQMTDANGASSFVQIVESMCSLVGKVVQNPVYAQGIDAIAARPTKGLDLLSEESPPGNIDESLVTLLAAECLASIADSMALSQGVSGSNSRLSPIVQIGRVHSSRELSPLPLMRRSSVTANDSSQQASSSLEDHVNGAFHDPRPKRRDSRADSSSSTNSSSGNKNPDSNRDTFVRRELVLDMMQSCWEPMLHALALLLKCCNNENIVQFILKAYMSMTNTCGILGLEEARNAFILSLCNFSLPNWHSSAAILPPQMARPNRSGSELEPKHLQALKALFNIAHGLGSILGSAWHIVLETFEQLDHIMYCAALERKLTTSGTVHVTGMGPSRSNSLDKNGPGGSQGSDWHLVDDEMAIVESMLRFLFNSTKYLDEDALKDIQTALTQLSFTVLAHTETMRTLSKQESAAKIAQQKHETENSPKNEGWISSTVMNFTSSLADAATATLTSVTYDGDDYSGSTNDYATLDDAERLDSRGRLENEMPDLGIDLTLDTKHNHHGDDKQRTHSQKQQQQVESRGGNSFDVGSQGLASPPKVPAPLSGDVTLQKEMKRHRTSELTSPTLMSPKSGYDGVIARATYRNPPFAIEKLVETTRLNIFRVHILWEMTQSVLLIVAGKSDAKLRLFGAQAMEELVSAALLFEPNEENTNLQGYETPPKKKSISISSPKNERSGPGLLSPVTPEPTTPKSRSNANDDPTIPRLSRRTSDGKIKVKKLHPLPRTNYQKELIEGFSHLFKSSHFDTRMAAVQSLHRIVGTCGHVLDEGWCYIVEELRLITGAPNPDGSPTTYSKTEISKLVPIAFKSVQLIVDDFLPVLGLECKKDLATCIRAFGDQEPHRNISLTSITMLWAMCDHVQKECRTISAVGKDAPEVEQCNVLLLHVFEQLSSLSLDERPEVRNCAIRTLCSIIVACAPKLTMDSWRICCMKNLFPLLEEIIRQGSQASTDQVHGEVLGRLSGERTRLHRSHDTLEKQWHETIVTALQGATRVVRASIQYAGDQPWALKTWEIMLETVRSVLITKPKNKLALAGTRSLQELAALISGSSRARLAAVGMQVVNGALVKVNSGGGKAENLSNMSHSDQSAPHLAEGTPIPKLWEIVWIVYKAITSPVGDANSNGTTLELQGVGTIEVATDITSGIGELYSNNNHSNQLLRAPAHVELVLGIFDRLLDAFPANSKHITGLERATLTSFQALPPVSADVLWPKIFNQLRRYMRGSENKGSSIGFATKAQALFVTLYEKNAPSAARALVFEGTIDGLILAMDNEVATATAGSTPPQVVWDINSLLPIFKYGLRSLSTCGWLPSRTEDVWMNLLRALKLAISPTQKQADTSAPGNPHLDLTVQDGLQLLNVVMEEARPLILASRVPSGVQDRLFELLHGGCSVRQEDTALQASPEKTGSFVLSRACLEHLLTLSSVSSSETEELAERVLTTLMSGVDQVASSYLSRSEKPSSSDENTEEVNEADIVALLEKLRLMEIQSLPKRLLSEFNHASIQAAGSKAHLLLLFPTLNRLVLVDSLAIRTELQKIFADLAGALVMSKQQ